MEATQRPLSHISSCSDPFCLAARWKSAFLPASPQQSPPHSSVSVSFHSSSHFSTSPPTSPVLSFHYCVFVCVRARVFMCVCACACELSREEPSSAHKQTRLHL